MGDDTSDRVLNAKSCMPGLVFWTSSAPLIDLIAAIPPNPLMSA